MTTDREREDQHDRLMLAADASLTSAERKAFLDRFPHQRGAHVADLLDILDDNDSNIEIVEQMQERYGDKVPERGLLATAVQLALGVYGSSMLATSWESVEPLIERIRPLLHLTGPELLNERAKRATLEVLAPLGFEDFEDDESPHLIWHKLMGSFDHRKVNLANVVSVAYHAGKNEGMEELRAKARSMFGVAPLNHTHPREDDGQ